MGPPKADVFHLFIIVNLEPCPQNKWTKSDDHFPPVCLSLCTVCLLIMFLWRYASPRSRKACAKQNHPNTADLTVTCISDCMHPPLGWCHLDHTFYGRIAGGMRGRLLVNSLYALIAHRGVMLFRQISAVAATSCRTRCWPWHHSWPENITFPVTCNRGLRGKHSSIELH